MLSVPFRCVLVAVIACAACTNASDDGTSAPAATPDAAVAPRVDEEQPFEPASGEEGQEGEVDEPWIVPDAGPPPAPPADAGPDTKPAGAMLAGESARQLAAMKITAYEHTTFVDEATGTFKYDCSGFLGYSLNRVLPAHLAAVKTFNAVSRPLAKHYELFFESIDLGAKKSGWSRVARAIDLRPGDVVAWLKPADLVSSNTGHVMIVRDKPAVNPKRADEVIVPITDSSASFHGSTDTRYPSGEGLGNGPIGLIVDGSGKAIKYRWTGGVSTKEYATAISLGRPE
jgi:hypothetical protein